MMRRLLIIILLFFLNALTIGQTAVLDSPQAPIEVNKTADTAAIIFDTSFIEVRQPSAEKIKDFKNDRDFWYDREDVPHTIWDKIWLWFMQQINNIFFTKAFGVFIDSLLYAIIGISIIFIVYNLVKSKKHGVLYKQRNDNYYQEYLEEDIKAIDFNVLIKNAVEQNDFKTAIRFYYIKILKKLSAKKIIDLKIHKTNRHYLKEIKTENIKNSFDEITYLFEWICYGEIGIDANGYREVENKFSDFEINLEKSR
jgi:hypothetical protein